MAKKQKDNNIVDFDDTPGAINIVPADITPDEVAALAKAPRTPTGVIDDTLKSAGIKDYKVAPVKGGIAITFEGWTTKIHADDITPELVLNAVKRRPNK